jgi:hypothetical protein
LQLFANGYKPTPNLDKRCMLKGWASAAFVDNLSPETVEGWKKQQRGFKATGVLVRDGLMPVDFDIRDEAMVERMLGELHAIAPEAAAQAPLRTGKFPKLMVFCRWRTKSRSSAGRCRIRADLPSRLASSGDTARASSTAGTTSRCSIRRWRRCRP